jgi:hypothetical protein
MCQNWIDGKVTVGHVTKAIDQAMQNPVKPNTPMYLSEVVINLKNSGPQNALEQFRELWQANKDGEQ